MLEHMDGFCRHTIKEACTGTSDKAYAFTVKSEGNTKNINYLMDWATSTTDNRTEPKENRNYFYIQSSAAVGGRFVICSEFCGDSDDIIRLTTYDTVEYKRTSVKYIFGAEGNDPMYFDPEEKVLYIQYDGQGTRLCRGYSVDTITGIVGNEVYSKVWSLYWSGITKINGVWYGMRNSDPYHIYKNIDTVPVMLDGVLQYDSEDKTQLYNTISTRASLKKPIQSLAQDKDGNIVVVFSYPNCLMTVSVKDDVVKTIAINMVGEYPNGHPLGEMESACYDPVNDRYFLVGQFKYENEAGVYYHTIFEYGDKVEENRPFEYYGWKTVQGEKQWRHSNYTTDDVTLYVDRLEDKSIVRRTGEIYLPFESITAAAAHAKWLMTNTGVSAVVIKVNCDTTDFVDKVWVAGDLTIEMGDGAKIGQLLIHQHSRVAVTASSGADASIGSITLYQGCKARIRVKTGTIYAGGKNDAGTTVGGVNCDLTIDRVGACDLRIGSAFVRLYDQPATDGTATSYTGSLDYSFVTSESTVSLDNVTVSNKLVVR